MAASPRRPRVAALPLVAFLAFSCIQPVQSRTWLYALIHTDYGGELMLPHFINYYHQLGVTYRRFLVVLHHTPGKYPRRGLELAAGVCQGYSVECRLWEGPFSLDVHMEHMLRMLDDYVYEPFDWVVVADGTELQEWPSFINEELKRIGDAGGNYVRSDAIDRVAPGGALAPVAPATAVDAAAPPASLFDQFPLRCKVPDGTNRGGGSRIAAFRAFLRPGRSLCEIITPDQARSYYGPCAPGAPCPRARRANLGQDLFNITPYWRYEDQYRYLGTPRGVKMPPHVALPAPAEFTGARIPAHRFRWHGGALDEARDRLQAYRGNCTLERSDDAACEPLLPGWRESARAYAALAAARRLDLRAAACAPAAPGEDVAVDTTYAGLAWEEFEGTLTVVSKVRNTVRGDSQTRQAAKLAAGLAGGGSADS